MTMESTIKRHPITSKHLLFLVEQWIALLVGVVCLIVFSWTAVERYHTFSAWRLSRFNTTMLVSIGWLLTIAIGLIGVALVRFAFYKPSEPGPDAKSLDARVQMPFGGLNKPSDPYVSITANRRGR